MDNSVLILVVYCGDSPKFRFYAYTVLPIAISVTLISLIIWAQSELVVAQMFYE